MRTGEQISQQADKAHELIRYYTSYYPNLVTEVPLGSELWHSLIDASVMGDCESIVDQVGIRRKYNLKPLKDKSEIAVRINTEIGVWQALRWVLDLTDSPRRARCK